MIEDIQREADRFAREFVAKGEQAKLRKVRRLNTERARTLIGFNNYLEALKQEIISSLDEDESNEAT